MYESTYNLQIKSTRGSKSATEELSKRRELIKSTGLTSIHNEDICLVMCDEIISKVKYINTAISKINTNKSIVKKNVIIDAYTSATIEGARTTVEEVVDILSKQECTNINKSNQMVINTIKACNIAYESNITIKNIRKIWEIITYRVCENEGLKGEKFRNGMVYIGNNIRIVHTPCEASKIESKMQEMFNWALHSNIDTLIKSCILHFYTAYIHPFCDGNGRIARLLNSSYLIHNGYINIKYVSISESINNELTMYYKALKDSEYTYNNILDITPFIDYMLDRICDSIDTTISKYNKLSDKQLMLLQKMKNNGKNSEITVEKASRITKLSLCSTRNLLNKLVDMQYLTKFKQGRMCIYKLKNKGE